MTHDVSQWLTEIKALRQQLAEAQQDREQAYTSAANWQRLYETEAQQRRQEAARTRQTIADLTQELQQLKGTLPLEEGIPTDASAIQAEVEKLQTVTALQQKLLEALTERDRLAQALKLEQANHAQTRKGLTTALGDAIDMLSKEKG
ncbi:MAG: hypothetical protein KME45_22835 [Stenomitos rutilans HA7619-LM2]|jgi:DNA-binding transcriptional regulator GbsR (MarR family)|nr:hypothetical protein [Stenomitos rutilans HA7619-LM2]